MQLLEREKFEWKFTHEPRDKQFVVNFYSDVNVFVYLDK